MAQKMPAFEVWEPELVTDRLVDRVTLDGPSHCSSRPVVGVGE